MSRAAAWILASSIAGNESGGLSPTTQQLPQLEEDDNSSQNGMQAGWAEVGWLDGLLFGKSLSSIFFTPCSFFFSVLILFELQICLETI
jgi:hypothetical protein